jgi:hypothetical protein
MTSRDVDELLILVADTIAGPDAVMVTKMEISRHERSY